MADTAQLPSPPMSPVAPGYSNVPEPAKPPTETPAENASGNGGVQNAEAAAEPAPEKRNTQSRIIMLVDETGSMGSFKDITIESYNQWLDANRTLEADETVHPKFTLVKFNTSCRIEEYDSVETAPRLTHENYHPRDRTAMYDAIGTTLQKYEQEQDNIMVILTDGQENASHRFSEASIQPLIQNLENNNGWLFHFLGADQNAWAAAQRIGLSDSRFANSYAATQDGYISIFNQNADQVKAYRGYQARKQKGIRQDKASLLSSMPAQSSSNNATTSQSVGGFTSMTSISQSQTTRTQSVVVRAPTDPKDKEIVELRKANAKLRGEIDYFNEQREKIVRRR